jgi:hypothetical protein
MYIVVVEIGRWRLWCPIMKVCVDKVLMNTVSGVFTQQLALLPSSYRVQYR